MIGYVTLGTNDLERTPFRDDLAALQRLQEPDRAERDLSGVQRFHLQPEAHRARLLRRRHHSGRQAAAGDGRAVRHQGRRRNRLHAADLQDREFFEARGE